MKVQVVIILGLAASVLAVPNLRAPRQSQTTQASSDCRGSLSSVSDLLGTLGNLLDGLLNNVGYIKLAGIVGPGDLIDLRTLLGEVRSLLQVLLRNGGVNDSPQNRGLLLSLVDGISNLVDSLVGEGAGSAYACRGGGVIGTLLGNLTGNVLVPVLTQVVGLVDNILLLLS